jgi:hypothetical protein
VTHIASKKKVIKMLFLNVADWIVKSPVTKRLGRTKVHSTVRNNRNEIVTRCRQIVVPEMANKRMAAVSEITCLPCLNKLYNPTPNKLITKRRWLKLIQILQL